MLQNIKQIIENIFQKLYLFRAIIRFCFTCEKKSTENMNSHFNFNNNINQYTSIRTSYVKNWIVLMQYMKLKFTYQTYSWMFTKR